MDIHKYLTSLAVTNDKELMQLAETSVRIILILVAARILLSISSRAIGLMQAHLEHRAGNDAESIKRIETLGQVFGYIATVTIGIIAAMEIMHQLGISIAPVLATAGVVGVAVGFGAQSLIKDYFNGFFLLLENQVRQGDVIEAAGKGGLVEEVTLRHIKMRDYDGNVHVIPNGIITTVTNFSRGFAYSVIDIGLAYAEDIDLAMEVMREVGTELRHDPHFGPKIIGDMEMAGVDKLDNATVVLRCRFKVLPLEQWDIRREYLLRFKKAYDLRKADAAAAKAPQNEPT